MLIEKNLMLFRILTKLLSVKQSNKGAQAIPVSPFFLLGNGLDAFVARAVLANVAERSIDVQYYLYHNDLVGSLLSYSLLKAADRDVRVRMLLDDMGLKGRGMTIATFDSHPNIEIRIFNPFNRNVFREIQFLTRFGGVTRRMHNKSFTIDNQSTIVGGRNIGNEYFDADPDLAFGDLDVIAIGPVVQEVSTSFDKYWNSELAYPISTLKNKVSVEKLDEVRPEWDKLIDEYKDSAYYSAYKKITTPLLSFSGNQVSNWVDIANANHRPSLV